MSRSAGGGETQTQTHERRPAGAQATVKAAETLRGQHKGHVSEEQMKFARADNISGRP